MQKLDTTARGRAATRPHFLTLGPKMKSPFAALIRSAGRPGKERTGHDGAPKS